MNLLIDGYKFVLTCYACPEQYDVFDDEGNQVAYLRLRHSHFRVECPDYGGEIVYSANTVGDGIFEDNERYRCLCEAVIQIQLWIIRQQFKPVEWNDDDE